MIRNKWLWTAFALLISVSFLGYFSPRSGGCGRSAFLEDMKAGAQGRLFEKNVPREEFAGARFFEMGLRENAPLTPRAKERLHKRTWQRLVALQTADRMGVQTSPAEVLEAIARDPNFAANGAFSRERYRSVVESQLHVNIETFESYLRQELTIQKLIGMIESVFLTSPIDLQRRLSNITDSFAVEYVVLKNAAIKTEVKATPDDAQKFYEEHKKLFMEPAKVSVKYVSFPITNYLANIPITESDMKDYYEEYDEEFKATDTNSATTRLPFEQVTNTIAARLKVFAAERAAKDAATELTLRLTDRSEKALGFDEAAAGQKLAVSTSAFFTISSKVPGLDVGRDFNKAAFDLDPDDRTRSFSDPIAGSNAVYVLSICERVEERIPAFAEVKNRAMELARRDAQEAAFLQKCKDIRRTIRKDMEEGKSFQKAAASAAGLTVKTTETFSAYTGLTNDLTYSDELVSSVIYMHKGELSDLVPTTNGVLLAYIRDRQTGDPATMLLLKPQMQSLLDRYNVSVLFHDWEDYLLSKAAFEDYAPIRQEEEEPTSDTEEEDANTAIPFEP
jgi:hypothetical protein